ncbi:MAG: PAS domain S-box protein [Gammaproteobacteria bacterium]|nr:MAG: PAS domain S-box protein [Gammaproteobacteria bacterium]
MLPDKLSQSMLESTPDAMVIVDAAGTICFANRQAGALFGYGAGELLGQSVEALLPARFRGSHAAHRGRFAGEMRVRPMGSGLDLYAVRRDGSEFPAEISLAPIEGIGEPLIAAAIRDVTARKRIEAELVAAREAADAANRAKSRFLAAASHDLRQPLQTLSMLNGALRRAVKASAPADALEHQALAIGTMSRLLNSLLDISKLESGAIKPEVTDFEVATLFDELRAEFTALAASKGLELRVDACVDCAHSDRSLVGQILQNLVANAIKYTREGWVQLRCLHERALIRIEVLDTGIGIAPEALGQIFEEFYQVDVPANTVRDGCGLGLSIVERLVRLLDLRLEVDSKPGRGSRFSLSLPAASAVPRGAGAGGQTMGDPAASANATVLLIEDDAAVRNATRLLLQAEGYQVTAAGSLDEALQLAATARTAPRLLISDYHLGSGVTGTDAIAALRHSFGRETAALLITGDTSTAMQEIGRDPRLRLMSKPVDAEQLLAAVQELIESG